MAEVSTLIDNADAENTVWNATALCTNNRIFKLTSLSIIQHEADDVQERNLSGNMEVKSVCNVERKKVPV